MARPAIARARLETFLLSEAREGRIPTAVETAKHLGISRIYVHQVRSKLIAQGKLPPSPRGNSGVGDAGARLSLDLDRVVRDATLKSFASATKPLTAAISETARELFAFDPDARAMTPDERRVFYSELARKTHRQEIKVSALAALDRLDARIRAADHIGPPDPLTETEANERLAELERARADLAARS